MNLRNLLALCLITFNMGALQAQLVHFQGVYKSTGNNSSLDSVRIVNLSTGKDTVLVRPYSVDLKTYVSARTAEPSTSSEFLLNYFGDGAHALKFITENIENVEVELYAYNGVRLAIGKDRLESGVHTVKIVTGGLPYGAYFVILSREGTRELHKLIIQNNSLGLLRPTIDFIYSSSFGADILNGGEFYNFTGYLNGFQEVEINNSAPAEGQIIKFEFEELLSSYKFTQGFMRINGLDYTFERNWKVRTPGGKWDKDSIWQADDNLNIYNVLSQCSLTSSYISYPKCIDVYNVGDTIKYCCQGESVYKDMQIEKQSDTLLQAFFIIDEANSRFKEIRYYYRIASLSKQAATGVTEIITSVSFTFENAPYTSAADGALRVALSEQDVLSLYKDFRYYYKNATYNGESTNEITTTLVKPLAIGESGSIDIELRK